MFLLVCFENESEKAKKRVEDEQSERNYAAEIVENTTPVIQFA